MEWQDIYTVPSRESVLLAFPDGEVRIGESTNPFSDIQYASIWVRLDMGDASASFWCPRDYRPTHWLPLPKAPRAE